MIAAQKHINKVNLDGVWFLFDVSNIWKVAEVAKWNNFNVLHHTVIIIHFNKTASIC